MYYKNENIIPIQQRLSVDKRELCQLLSCGEKNALRIAKEAGAAFRVGSKSVYYNVQKIQSYLNEVSG